MAAIGCALIFNV